MEKASQCHSFYHSSDVVRVNKYRKLRCAGHVARMEEGRSTYKILIGRPSHRREDNVKVNLKEIGISTRN